MKTQNFINAMINLGFVYIDNKIGISMTNEKLKLDLIHSFGINYFIFTLKYEDETIYYTSVDMNSIDIINVWNDIFKISNSYMRKYKIKNYLNV
jgi:hypothetical protein